MANASIDADTASTLNQFKEFLLNYNKLSEMCFVDCVHDLTARKVSDSENSCVLNCMDKYLKMSQRISQRFQEIQMQQQESVAGPQGSVSKSMFGGK